MFSIRCLKISSPPVRVTYRTSTQLSSTPAREPEVTIRLSGIVDCDFLAAPDISSRNQRECIKVPQIWIATVIPKMKFRADWQNQV